MCLIFFALNCHTEYSLILAGNRDEFYNRPTEIAHFWNTNPELFAGRDLKGGGTWLGVQKKGRFAALTNIRDMASIKENAPSRGNVVVNALTSESTQEDFISRLDEKSESYNGFNLLTFENRKMLHYSNQSKIITEVEPGIHGISNADLDTPWPKVQTAKKSLTNIMDEDRIDKEAIFAMLQSEKRYPLEKLPDTGLPEEKEVAVSSAFIKMDDYGTRCSSLVLIDYNGNITFEERTYQNGDSGHFEQTKTEFSTR